MRRLPIYFLIDVSESMVGDPIEQVQQGMRTIVQELRVDPYALETAFVSVIAFAGKAEALSPLTELYKFYPPTFPIGGGTSLGNALTFLMNRLGGEIQPTTAEVKGDWKPIVFLFTDGNPTDNYSQAFSKWNASYRKKCNLVAISIGDNVNTQILGQISDNVLLLKNTDKESFTKFFKWVTASIKTTSMSVSETASDELKLAPTDGINLEKVDTQKAHKVDENFAVLHGKCQNTKNSYLVKFAKRLTEFDGLPNFNTQTYKLVGAYPIDGNAYSKLSGDVASRHLNLSDFIGSPTCPCCGDQFGMVVCGRCSGTFCVGDNPHCTCPWCGNIGELTFGGEDISVNRTQG